MRIVQLAYAAVYIAIVVLFGACAVALVGFAAHELWRAVSPATDGNTMARFQLVLESIGLATIGVAAAFPAGGVGSLHQVERSR